MQFLANSRQSRQLAHLRAEINARGNDQTQVNTKETNASNLFFLSCNFVVKFS